MYIHVTIIGIETVKYIIFGEIMLWCNNILSQCSACMYRTRPTNSVMHAHLGRCPQKVFLVCAGFRPILGKGKVWENNRRKKKKRKPKI